jgi:hypothetical protein
MLLVPEYEVSTYSEDQVMKVYLRENTVTRLLSAVDFQRRVSLDKKEMREVYVLQNKVAKARLTCKPGPTLLRRISSLHCQQRYPLSALRSLRTGPTAATRAAYSPEAHRGGNRESSPWPAGASSPGDLEHFGRSGSRATRHRPLRFE